MRRSFAFLSISCLIMTTLAAVEHEHDKSVAHGEHPVLQKEHADVMELVPESAVTHRVVADGRWSEPKTWHGGKLPEKDANVLVPHGKSVTVDGVESTPLRTIRVDGKLAFAPDRNTQLLVDTLVIAEEGELEIGTSALPIARDKQARVIFADRGPIDTRWDPKHLSRGLLSHGKVIMQGAAATPQLRLAAAPRKGDVKLILSKVPENWRPGDRLIVPAVRYRGRDEERTILAIDGREVTIDALEQDHIPPAADLLLPVAHISRNVIVESENVTDVPRAGHIMFMHSPDVHVGNVAFHHLGRTDKRNSVNDPLLGGEKQITHGTGTNPRGRYAVHFHRTGTVAAGRPATVKGSVVLNSPGWGFVNHSSFVEIDHNITFNVTGSGFVTEAGDEIGTFHRNFAIRSRGSGHDVSERTAIQDFGHEGDGFWFQGAGVSVEGNIAAGQAQTGFIFFTRGLEQAGLGRMRFAAANLKDRSWCGDRTDVEVGQVPVRSFRDNEVFASHTGIIPRHHLSGTKDGGPRYPGVSVIADSTVWNSEIGVHVRYSSNVTLRNLRLIGNRDPKDRCRVGVSGQIEEVNNIRCENLRIKDFNVGIDVRESGSWIIDGGTFDNGIDIMIPTTIERGRVVTILGDVRFAAQHSAEHFDIYLGAEFGTLLQGRYVGRNPNFLFTPNVIEYRGQQLYYLEQAANHVPLRNDLTAAEQKKLGIAKGSVPEELIGKTNRELWRRFGLAVAGAVAPADSTVEPRIHALIGPKSTYPKPEIVSHAVGVEQLSNFKLVCFAADKQQVAESESMNLQAGWNLITLTIDSHPRSFLVHGGKTAKSDTRYNEQSVTK